jgi:hypothetical protein
MRGVRYREGAGPLDFDGEQLSWRKLRSTRLQGPQLQGVPQMLAAKAGIGTGVGNV